MKKYIAFLLIVLSFSSIQSQGITDALRFSQNNLNGTARFSAMSGAFGALGGDFSAINVNPAGAAVFANNQVSLTLSNYNTQNNSDYFNTKTDKNNNVLDLNQAGGIFVFYNDNPKSDWQKFTLAVNYTNSNNFDNALFSAGTNPNHSIDNYFLFYANANANHGGILLGTLQNSYYENLNYEDQQAFLGYQGYVINPVNASNSNNNVYVTNVPSGGKFYQENYFQSTGYNGKLNFNIATQYKDKFYFGMNLNSHFTDYRHTSSFYEINNNSSTSGLRSLHFDNDLHTFGSGFSFQLGAIAKVTKELRFGLTYDSPTWYKLNDELKQTLSSTGYNYGNPPNASLSSTTVDSNILIIYQPYTLHDPGKWTGSTAYIFGKKGLISIDYSLKDYSNTHFSPKNDFQNANHNLSGALTTASELRIGAEYRIKQWSLRGGYRNEQSPYKDTAIVGDLTGYSGGLGYSLGATKVDLAYSLSQRKSQQSFFSQGFTDGATINTKISAVSLTVLFEL